MPELLAAPLSEPVFICEGEKDAENVAALGFVATTNPGGALKWTGDLNRWFAGRKTVYILEDNDPPDDPKGQRHARKVAEALRSIVGEIRIVSFPELDKKGDVSDWLEQGGTAAQLLARAKAGRVPSKGYDLVRASDIQPENIDWLWHDHLPGDQLEILAGLPGAGKSQIKCGYTACVTTEVAWPDGANGQGRHNVIILTAEDTRNSIRVPRLIAAGADRDRVYIFGWVREDDKKRMFLLAEDLAKLEEAMAEIGDVGLICIDPNHRLYGRQGR